MSEENPFRTLGFNPRAFKSLHDDEIFSLVKAQYRALQQIHHPDINRRRNAGQMSTAISLAYAKVNYESDPASFNYWKEVFLKSDRGGNKQNYGLLARTELAEARESHLQGIVIDCLKGVYLNKPLRPVPLPAPIATVNDGCAMAIEDTVKSAWLARERPCDRKLTPRQTVMRSVDRSIDPTLFELEVTREGALIYRKLVLHQLHPKDDLPPSKGAWIRRDANGVGYYWTTLPAKTRVFKARIVGSIDSDRLRHFWDETGSATQRTIMSGLTAEETSVIESMGYTTDQVRPYLWLLKPELCRGHTVVSMSPEGDKFLFLGQLSFIADESKAPRL